MIVDLDKDALYFVEFIASGEWDTIVDGAVSQVTIKDTSVYFTGMGDGASRMARQLSNDKPLWSTSGSVVKAKIGTRNVSQSKES